MLNEINKLAQTYIPTALDYAHPKIWYRIYNCSDDNKHPDDLEHVRSFKTLRQVYAYALGDREELIGCIGGGCRLLSEEDSKDRNTLNYAFTSYVVGEIINGKLVNIPENYNDFREFTIRKLRPKDIKLGWLIRFELYTNCFGFIRKIHTDYKEKDYKDYDGNGGDKFCGCDEDPGSDESDYKSEIEPQYYKEAAKYVIL